MQGSRFSGMTQGRCLRHRPLVGFLLPDCEDQYSDFSLVSKSAVYARNSSSDQIDRLNGGNSFLISFLGYGGGDRGYVQMALEKVFVMNLVNLVRQKRGQL